MQDDAILKNFSCLTFLARTFSIMLNRHLCLVPDLRVKVITVSLLNIMLAVGFS